jgi:hypothetical protein
MTRGRALTVACVIGVVAASAPADAARRKAEPTLATLAQRPVAIDRSQPVVASSDDAAQGYEQFLALDQADAALRAQASNRPLPRAPLRRTAIPLP